MNTGQRFSMIAALAAALAASGCGGKAISKEPDTKAAAARNPMEITAGDDLMRQIRVGELPRQDVAGAIKLAGRIEADETRMARVSSPVTGRIVELEVAEGQMVKRGEVLAKIHSTDLSSAQSTFLKALTQNTLSKKAVDRARQLLEAGVIGEAEVQRRDAELQEAAAELASSRDQLSVLGMSPETITHLEQTRAVNSVTPILSSIDGRVLQRKVTFGQVIQAAEITFVVADLSNVWLVADVPEQNASALQTGQIVNAEIPAVSSTPITARINFVSPIVNPETRTISVRTDLRNPAGKYKPAMLATITLIEGAEHRRVVPGTAIVREDNQDNVLVQTAARTFVLRPVSLGMEFRDVRVLESGISDKEKIVLDGAFHLNNERKRRVIQGE